MELWNRLKKSFSGIGQAFVRYPVTILWLIGIATLTAMEIGSYDLQYGKLIFTFVSGAVLSIVAQQLHERFYRKTTQRWVLLAGSVLLTALYYFTLVRWDSYDYIYFIRSGVFSFALFIAFIWIPTAKNEKLFFHQHFLAIFKSILTILLFSLVLTIGTAAIILTVDNLLFSVPTNAVSHAMNIIWSLFAPIYFLGMIPYYDERDSEETYHVPRFLEILLVYIVIPLTAIYTVILLLYVVLNISGEFWTDNLLEPMLVSYAIVVIVVYLLTCNLDHRFASWFRKIFPKIMLPIVAFQTLSSILKIQEMGITYGRYYVILFGLFAVFSSIVFSFFKPHQNGWIAIVLLVLGLISITPPIDAFTVARNSQLNRLETALIENDMLVDGDIQPKKDVSETDRIIISKSLDNLVMFGEIDRVTYLPENFSLYADFERVFGFPMQYGSYTPTSDNNRYAYLNMTESIGLEISGMDYWNYISFTTTEDVNVNLLNNHLFVMTADNENYFNIQLKDEDGNVLIEANTAEDMDALLEETTTKQQVDLSEMTLIYENKEVKLTIVLLNLSQYSEEINGEAYLFVDYK